MAADLCIFLLTLITLALATWSFKLDNLDKCPNVRVLSIASSGAVNDTVNITVSYLAPYNHNLEWIFVTKYFVRWRTTGEQRKSYSNECEYTSVVNLSSLNTTMRIYVQLSDDEENIFFELNPDELEIQQNQTINQPPSGYLYNIDTEYNVPFGLDCNINMSIQTSPENVSLIVTHGVIQAWFIGMNTTTSPAKVFEVYDFDAIVLSEANTAIPTPDMTITVNHHYLGSGGLLGVSMPYSEPLSGLVNTFRCGRIIRITTDRAPNVFPTGEVAVFTLPSQTFIYPSKQSIICTGVGSTISEMSIYKKNNDKLEKVPAETIINSAHLRSLSYTLSPEHDSKSTEQYLCRITNGNQMADTETDVVFVDLVEFDDDNTGIIRNTSDEVLISCKASGNPLPKILINLYENHGKDLITSEAYQVAMTYPNNVTAQAVLSLTPTEAKVVHTVYCVGIQNESPEGGYYREQRKIEVFPGMAMETDWDLYYNIK